MADSDALSSAYVQASPSPRRRAVPRWLRIVAWTLLTLVLLLVVVTAACVLWLRSVTRAALPQLDGKVHLSGLSAPVTVRRDAHGVPHIQAATQDDLFVAQGYVTAQDRLWQMDTYRRSANGELAEVLGSRVVRHDIVERVLGFRKTGT
jgi:penicillin amidase